MSDPGEQTGEARVYVTRTGTRERLSPGELELLGAWYDVARDEFTVMGPIVITRYVREVYR